jgi:uncharacterized membrane protein (TIGR02234 family)
VTSGRESDAPVPGGPESAVPLSGGPVAGGPAPRGAAPGGAAARREYALVLGTAAAGAVLVLLSVRQGWAQVVTAAPAPLPRSTVRVSGQDLVPVVGALAVASLAALAAVIATRGLARRLVGVFLATSGALIAVLVSAGMGSADVLAAARGAVASQAGSAIAGSGAAGPGATPGATGGTPGVSGAAHVVMASFPWRPLAAVGGLAVLAAGILVTWRGPRWPAMSSRYSRAGGGKAQPVADASTLWESLSRGVDPTEQPGQPGRPLGS